MSTTPTNPLLSLCCGAHPTAGTGALRRHTSGLYSGFCGVCGERSPFAPGGLTGGQPRMALSPLQAQLSPEEWLQRKEAVEALKGCATDGKLQGLLNEAHAAVERRSSRESRTLLLLALVALSGWLLFVGLLTMRALEGGKGGGKATSQEGLRSINGMGGVHAPQGNSRTEGRQP